MYWDSIAMLLHLHSPNRVPFHGEVLEKTFYCIIWILINRDQFCPISKWSPSGVGVGINSREATPSHRLRSRFRHHSDSKIRDKTGWSKPSSELHPGPPLYQKMMGSLVGSFWDSTNLKNFQVPQFLQNFRSLPVMKEPSFWDSKIPGIMFKINFMIQTGELRNFIVVAPNHGRQSGKQKHRNTEVWKHFSFQLPTFSWQWFELPQTLVSISLL